MKFQNSMANKTISKEGNELHVVLKSVSIKSFTFGQQRKQTKCFFR